MKDGSLLFEVIRGAFIQVMIEEKGSRKRTAERLGVSIRTVRTWIYRFGVNAQFPAPYQRPRMNAGVEIGNAKTTLEPEVLPESRPASSTVEA